MRGQNVEVEIIKILEMLNEQFLPILLFLFPFFALNLGKNN
jgi:hypothetical protein